MVQWCYDVADSLQENRSLVYIAMRILDSYCATVSLSYDGDCCALDGETYELASMSAMFLAVRIAGTGSLRLPELTSMSRGGITVQDFVNMGTKMIRALNWGHRTITPIDFLGDLLALLPSAEGNAEDSARSTSVLETANYLAEVSVFDVSLSRNRPSEVALASLLIALKSSASSAEVKMFSQAVEQATGIECDSFPLRALCTRLEAIYCQSYQNESAGPHLVLDEDREYVEPSQVFVSSPMIRALGHSTVHTVVSADDLELVEHNKQKRRVTSSSDFVSVEMPPLKRTKRNLAEVL